MKRKAAIIFSMVLSLSLLVGCGNKLEVEESTVYVDKDGSVISVDIESFEKDYYDEKELKEYIDEEIDAYTSENGKKSVKLQDVSVEDSVATLKLEYETATDYTNFNGIELYTGTVVKAMAAGYDFNVDFVSVEDGVVLGTADRDKILQNDDYKVAIIKANTNVQVEGEILFVSTENVELTGKDSVSIREGYSLAQTEAVDTDATEEVEATEAVAESTEVVENTEASNRTSTVVTDTDDEFAYETDVYTYIIFK